MVLWFLSLYSAMKFRSVLATNSFVAMENCIVQVLCLFLSFFSFFLRSVLRTKMHLGDGYRNEPW